LWRHEESEKRRQKGIEQEVLVYPRWKLSKAGASIGRKVR
jgi:hypothetical protein